MSAYEHIKNPETGRNVSIYGKLACRGGGGAVEKLTGNEGCLRTGKCNGGETRK